MVSISALGHQQAGYYLNLAQEDYYLAGGEPPGVWLGKGAELLGLSGYVEREAFLRLFQGFAPDGDCALVQNARDRRHQPGWDLTFSAPKSVSTLWAMLDAEQRAAIEKAHFAAIQAGLSYLEEEMAFTRRGKGGARLEKCSLVIAAFPHGESREHEPQLHTHHIVFNVCVRLDGTTGTLLSQPFYRAKMTAGALYRAELATQLRRLGLSLVTTKNGFEIAGVPRALMETFSTRRQQIEQFLQASGHEGAPAAAVATLRTRQAKEAVSRDILFEQWRLVGERYGFGREQALALIGREQVTSNAPHQAQEALREALETITAQNSSFTAQELTRRLAEEAPHRYLDVDTVRHTVANYLRSSEAIPLGQFRGAERFTTREMMHTEAELLACAERLHKRDSSMLSERALQEVLTFKPGLSIEQEAALRHLICTPGQIHLLQGAAGTGKTALCEVVYQIATRAGYTILGAALAAKAAQGLQEGAGIPSQTLHATLPALERMREQKERGAAYGVLADSQMPTSKLLLIVDEAAMVGTRQMHRLLTLAEALDIHIILVGDPRQLQPIEAGAPFSALAKRIGQAELTRSVRQREEWAQTAVRHFAFGEAGMALTAFVEHGLLTVTEDRRQAFSALISDWQRVGVQQPDANLIITATNYEATRLNRMAQEARRQAGILGGLPLVVGEVLLFEGDRVLFTKNNYLYGVKNGTLGTVAAVDPEKGMLTVKLDSGLFVTLPVSTYEHISLGYALTTHKAQGVTVENAFVLFGSSMQDQEMTYVQASRARGQTRLYTDQETAGENLSELVRQMNTSHQKELATEIRLQPTLRLALTR